MGWAWSIKKYNEKIKINTIKWAINDIIKNPPKGIEEVIKEHFKFLINDAKQLSIAFTSAISTWAATGFQRDLPHLGYVLMGFLTGAMVSHSTMNSPNTLPDSHIITPYVNNINDGSNSLPPQVPDTYKPEGIDVKKVIKINSGLIK